MSSKNTQTWLEGLALLIDFVVHGGGIILMRSAWSWKFDVGSDIEYASWWLLL